MDYYVLSEADRKKIAAHLAEEMHKVQNPRLRPHVPKHLDSTPDVYVAFTATVTADDPHSRGLAVGALGLQEDQKYGLPSYEPGTGTGTASIGTGNTPGYGICDIYKVAFTDGVPDLIPAGFQQTVYNLSPVGIPPNSWQLVERDKFGVWWFVSNPDHALLAIPQYDKPPESGDPLNVYQLCQGQDGFPTYLDGSVIGSETPCWISGTTTRGNPHALNGFVGLRWGRLNGNTVATDAFGKTEYRPWFVVDNVTPTVETVSAGFGFTDGTLPYPMGGTVKVTLGNIIGLDFTYLGVWVALPSDTNAGVVALHTLYTTGIVSLSGAPRSATQLGTITALQMDEVGTAFHPQTRPLYQLHQLGPAVIAGSLASPVHNVDGTYQADGDCYAIVFDSANFKVTAGGGAPVVSLKGGGITVGTTPITGGTSGDLIYNNGGVVGQVGLGTGLGISGGNLVNYAVPQSWMGL